MGKALRYVASPAAIAAPTPPLPSCRRPAAALVLPATRLPYTLAPPHQILGYAEAPPGTPLTLSLTHTCCVPIYPLA
jgi:hypothetical protein